VSFGTSIAKLIDVRPATAAVVLGLIASLTACARPGDTPSGTPAAPSRTVTLWASAAPAPPKGALPSRLAMRPGPSCAGPAGIEKPTTTKPAPRLSPEPEATARARRALEAMNPPVPRRGPLPDPVAAAAEGCARTLRLELTLLTGGRGGTPAEPELRRVLTQQGLSGITVAGDAFGAATGKACVHGVFTADDVELSIGPLDANGTCRP
jgi:hypothetical protein